MSHKAKHTEAGAAPAPKLRIRARAVSAAPRPPLVPRVANAAAAAAGPVAGASAASTAAATTVAQRRAAREQQRTQPPQRLSPKRSGGAKPIVAARKPNAPTAAAPVHPLEAEIDAPPAGVTDAASWFAAVTRAAEQMRAKHAGSAVSTAAQAPLHREEEEKHQPAPSSAAVAQPRILPRHEPSLPAAPRSPPALKKVDSQQQRKSKAALRVSYSDEVQFAEARHADDFAREQDQSQQQQQYTQQSFSLPITAAMRRDSDMGGAPTSRTAAREVYKMRYGRSKEEEAALAGLDPDDEAEQENDGDPAQAAVRSPPKKKVPKRILSDEPTLGAARRRAAMKEMQALAGGAAPPVSRSSRTGLPLSPIAASPRISSDAGSSSSRASSARSSAKSSPNASFQAASISPSRQPPLQQQTHPLSSSADGGTVDFTTMELKQLRDMNGTTNIDVFTSGEHSLRQSLLRDSISLSSSANAAVAAGIPASASGSLSASASLSASGSLNSSLRSSAADMIRRFREAPPKSKEQRAAEEAQLLQQQQQQQQQAARATAAAAAPASVAEPPKRSIPWWMAEALASPFSSVSASNDSAALPAARHNASPLALSTIVASPDVSLGESSMERERQHMHMGAAAETGEFNPRTNSILDASVSASAALSTNQADAGALSTAEFNPRTNSILLGESSTNFMDTLRSHSSSGSAAGPEDASLASFERHVKDTLDSPAPAASAAPASAHNGKAQNEEEQEEMLKTSDFSDFDNRRSGSGSGVSGSGSLFDAARRSRDQPAAAASGRRQPSGSSMYDSGGDDDIALSHSRSHEDDGGEDEARPLSDDDDEGGAEDLRRSRSAAASSHMLLDQTLASHIHSGLAMTLTSPSSVAHHAKAAASTSSTSPPTAAPFAAAGSHAAKPSTDSVASGVSNISGVSGTTLKSLPPLLSAHDSSPQITARGVADVEEEPSQFERRFVPPPERDSHLSGSRSRSASAASAKNAFKRAGSNEDDDAAASPEFERIKSPDTQQVQDLSRFVRKSYTGSNTAMSGSRSRSNSDLGAEPTKDKQLKEEGSARLSQSQSVPSAAPRDPQLSKSLAQRDPATIAAMDSEPAVDQSIEEEISMSHSIDESTEALKAEVRRSSQQQRPQTAEQQQQSKPSNDSSNVTPRTPLESTFASAAPQHRSPGKDEHQADSGSDEEEEEEDYSSSPPQAVGASVHMKRPLRGHRSAASAGASSGDSRDSTQCGVGASTLGASAQLLPFSPPATAEPLPPLPAFPAGPMTCDLCHVSSATSPDLSFVWCFDCRMKVCDPSPVLAHEASFEDLSVVPQLPPSAKSCHLDLHAAGKVFASHRVTRIPRGVVTEGSATSNSRPEYERSTAANRSAPSPSPTVDAGLLKPPALSVGGRSLSTPSPQPSSQSSSTSTSASSRDRTISAALQARGGFVEMVDANARMFAEVFNQQPQPTPPARAQSALSLREKDRAGSSLLLKERQTSIGDESNRSFGSVEEEPSDDASPRDRPSAPGSGSSSASEITPRGGRKQHRAQQSSVSSASSLAHSQRRARLLGMTPSPPISPVAAGSTGKKFGNDFASRNEIKAAAALEAEITGSMTAQAAADSSASPNDVIEEDLEASESPRIESDPLASLQAGTSTEQRPFMSPSALLTPSPSTLPPIAGAAASVAAPAPAIRASWMPTSPPQHAPHHASYTKVAGTPSLSVGKAPYLHLTPRDMEDDEEQEERKYPAPAAATAGAAANNKPSGANEGDEEEEDSTSGLNDSFIDRLLTKHHAAQKDEAKLASQPDAAALAHRAGIAAAAQASLSARESARARAVSASASTAPLCALCESAPGAVWCSVCCMYLCGTEQNNCDRDLHNQSEKMRSHARESAALKMKRDRLQALRGDDDDDEEQTQVQQNTAGGHSVFGNTTGILVNAAAPPSTSGGRISNASSNTEASPELTRASSTKHTGQAKSNPLHHSFTFPAEPAAAAVSTSAQTTDASPSIVPSALPPSPSPSPLPPRTGSAFLSFPLPADFGRDMRAGPRRTSPAAALPAVSNALAQREAVAMPPSPLLSQLPPPASVAAAASPLSVAAPEAATIENALSPSSASSAAAAAAMFGSSSSSLPSMEELEAALHENERNMLRLGIAPAPAAAQPAATSSTAAQQSQSLTSTKKNQAARDRNSDDEFDEVDAASSSPMASPSRPAQPRRQELASSAAVASPALDESALEHSSDSWDTSVSSMSESLFAATPVMQPKSSSKTSSDLTPTVASSTVPGREHASVRSCARGVQFSLDAAMARFNAQVAPTPAADAPAVDSAVTEKQLQQDAALKRVEDMMQQLLTAQQQQQQQQHAPVPAKSSTVPSALAHLPPAAQQAVKAALRAAALSQQVNSQLTARAHPGAVSHRGYDAPMMPQSMGQSLNLSGSSRRASFAQQAPVALASSSSKHAPTATAASSRRPSVPPLPLPSQSFVAPSARSHHRLASGPAPAATVTVEDESVSPVVSTRRSSAPNLAAAAIPAPGADRRHSTAVSVSQLNSRRSSIAAPATEAPQQQNQQTQQQQQMLFIIEQQQARIREQQQLLEESRRSIQMHQLELRQSQSRPAADAAFHPSHSQRPQHSIHDTEVPASAMPLPLASSFPPRASMFAPPQLHPQQAWLPSQSQSLQSAPHPLAASARAAPSERPPIRGMFAARSVMAQQSQQPQQQQQLHVAPMQSVMQLRPEQQQPQQQHQQQPQMTQPRAAWSAEQQAPAAQIVLPASAAPADAVDVASDPSPLSLQPTYALLSHTLDESAKRRQQLERMMR